MALFLSLISSAPTLLGNFLTLPLPIIFIKIVNDSRRGRGSARARLVRARLNCKIQISIFNALASSWLPWGPCTSDVRGGGG